MKKIVSLSLIVIILLYCVGCAKLVDTKTQEVETTVTDIYHRGAWTQLVFTGKVIIPISHPAKYEVTFTYKNVTLTVDDEDLYDYYKDKIGETAKCILIVEYYDDGSVYQTLKLKEEVK